MQFRKLFGVMEDDAEREARAAANAADTVAKIHAVEPARALHRTVASGKKYCLAFTGSDDFGFRLRARLLLDENEFSALPVAAGLTQQEDHLKRESDVAVEILMQTIVPAGLVMQQERRRSSLSRAMADFQEGGVIGGKRSTLVAERFDPLIGDRCEMGIRGGACRCDNFGQRMREIFIVADAEAMALHDDVAAEARILVIKSDDGGAFIATEELWSDGIAAGA